MVNKGPRILHMDCTAPQRKALAEQYSGLVHAPDLNVAYEALNAQSIDLVVTELIDPITGKSIKDFVDYIRSQESYVPVIVHTNFSRDRREELALEYGVDVCLAKTRFSIKTISGLAEKLYEKPELFKGETQIIKGHRRESSPSKIWGDYSNSAKTYFQSVQRSMKRGRHTSR